MGERREARISIKCHKMHLAQPQNTHVEPVGLKCTRPTRSHVEKLTMVRRANAAAAAKAAADANKEPDHETKKASCLQETPEKMKRNNKK